MYFIMAYVVVEELELGDSKEWLQPFVSSTIVLGVTFIGSRYYFTRNEIKLFILQQQTVKERTQLQEVLSLLPDSVIIASNFGETTRPQIEFVNSAAALLSKDNIDRCSPEELSQCNLLEHRLFEERRNIKEKDTINSA